VANIGEIGAIRVLRIATRPATVAEIALAS
jgi:hypothetical protein